MENTLIKAWYSSFNLVVHNSLSLGPAFVFSNGMLLRVFFVPSSTIFICFLHRLLVSGENKVLVWKSECFDRVSFCFVLWCGCDDVYGKIDWHWLDIDNRDQWRTCDVPTYMDLIIGTYLLILGPCLHMPNMNKTTDYKSTRALT